MRLLCHPVGTCTADCRLDATATLAGAAQLRVRYVLEGDLAKLRIPPRAGCDRLDGLWRHSCFEVFVRATGNAGYREANFSPSGAWAVYDFGAYRERAHGTTPVPAPEIAVSATQDRVELEAGIVIEDLCTAGGRLEVALAAVLEARDGGLSYWALTHPAESPDFHHPGSFALLLECHR